MKLRSEVLGIIADLIDAVGRQRMLDRPQIGDIVLVSHQQAEITAIAEKDMESIWVDFCRYQVCPIRKWFRYRRWVYAWEIDGIVSRAADRQRQQEIEKLEKML